MFARIVACVDAAPTGLHAMEVAIQMAARFQCGLGLVTVLPWKEGASDPALEALVPMDGEGRPVHRLLEDGAARARTLGVTDCRITYLRGSVTDALLQHLAAEVPDLVVVGTRGLSRGSRLVLGSVSSRLVTEAPCPVLVVRNVARKGRPGPDSGPTRAAAAGRPAAVK